MTDTRWLVRMMTEQFHRDDEGRPMREGRTPPPFVRDGEIEDKQCPCAGSRNQHPRPMNPSAIVAGVGALGRARRRPRAVSRAVHGAARRVGAEPDRHRTPAVASVTAGEHRGPALAVRGALHRVRAPPYLSFLARRFLIADLAASRGTSPPIEQLLASDIEPPDCYLAEPGALATVPAPVRAQWFRALAGVARPAGAHPARALFALL